MTSSNTTPTNILVNSSSSDPDFTFHCFDVPATSSIFFSFIITKLFIVFPLSIFILYLGHQQWLRKFSFATMSHSDIFTYHVIAIEFIFVLGVIILFCGRYIGISVVMLGGIFVSSVVFPGEMFFHIVTCMEHYLAVVHPITYLGLRQSGGVRIRNICIGCVWLLCFGWFGVAALYDPGVPYIPYFFLAVVSLVIVSFCCLSVLCVLIHPGVGETGKDRKLVGQSKQKAFQTITTILGVMLVSFTGLLVTTALDNSQVLSYHDGCVVLMSGMWFSLPSSVVSPLLYLHRKTGLLQFHQ